MIVKPSLRSHALKREASTSGMHDGGARVAFAVEGKYAYGGSNPLTTQTRFGPEKKVAK